jgi:hypothetical protein
MQNQRYRTLFRQPIQSQGGDDSDNDNDFEDWPAEWSDRLDDVIDALKDVSLSLHALTFKSSMEQKHDFYQKYILFEKSFGKDGFLIELGN